MKTRAQLDAEIAESLAPAPASRPMRGNRKLILRVFRRTEPGRYHVETRFHTWTVFRVKSEYGDFQWIIDRDDHPAFGQCDTLACVRATIIQATRDELRRGLR